ncbi:hypothetical protein ACIHEJ_26425 [Streptomyces sp. NPDC052301]|uniref:hypothetical protein n=1 Tax=Streptomyces sp. NPDC052301 TaxID=3365687 RepID=UPI0037CD2E2F
MERSSGVRLCATAAVSALSLALITGCSDGGSKDSGNAKGTDAAKPAAKALSAAELKKLIVAQGEVPGYKVGAVEGGVPDKSTLKVADPKCQPVAYAMFAQSPADAAAQTSTEVTENTKKTPTDDASSLDDKSFEDAMKKSMDIDITVVTLSSYDGDGAEKALQSLSDGVKACAGGFSAKPDGDQTKITKVSGEKSSATGDASVAFAATNTADGEEAVMHVEVVRHGNTLASYSTMNIGAAMSKKAYTVPAPVVEAQTAKLK